MSQCKTKVTLLISPSLQVSIVGLYLSSLTSLDLSYCPQVTDGGLLSLVLPQDHTGLSDLRYSTPVHCTLVHSTLVHLYTKPVSAGLASARP